MGGNPKPRATSKGENIKLPPGVCFNLNLQGSCTARACTFHHQCTNCGAEQRNHGAKNCPSGRNRKATRPYRTTTWYQELEPKPESFYLGGKYLPARSGQSWFGN